MSRRKRLTRKEKIELYGEREEIGVPTPKEEEEGKVFSPISPEDLGIEDKKIVKRIVIHSEEDVWDDDFVAPTQYYFVNALGHHIFVRTNKRDIAQEISDTLYGKDFYRVKRVIRAVVS